MIKAVVCGPTASGKSRLAYETAIRYGLEVISADSRQIYKGMETGTGQVPDEWRKKVPHHFMGFVSPAVPYSAAQYRSDVKAFIQRNSGQYIIAGGTGLYIQALLYGQKQSRPDVSAAVRNRVQEMLKRSGGDALHQELLEKDPEVASKIHPHDLFRLAKAYENLLTTGTSYREFGRPVEKDPIFKSVPVYVITMDREDLYARINGRVDEMIRGGWVKEVEKLLLNCPESENSVINALGYREIAAHLRGGGSLESAILEIKQKTRKYAKRQITFFKSQFPEAHFMSYEEIAGILGKHDTI